MSTRSRSNQGLCLITSPLSERLLSHYNPANQKASPTTLFCIFSFFFSGVFFFSYNELPYLSVSGTFLLLGTLLHPLEPQSFSLPCNTWVSEDGRSKIVMTAPFVSSSLRRALGDLSRTTVENETLFPLFSPDAPLPISPTE